MLGYEHICMRRISHSFRLKSDHYSCGVSYVSETPVVFSFLFLLFIGPKRPEERVCHLQHEIHPDILALPEALSDH